ncbi:MAG TPA: glycosyltransferase family 39 protein, partial [Thermomicrobiales bacterium]|nr:glycosyltransferase family 39 protein [Thermomicrobiales bacterium]
MATSDAVPHGWLRPAITAPTDDAVERRGLAAAWAVAPLVVVGLLLRLAVAARLPPHVDEGNMLLGIATVAQRGWPLLPSDVLYIHGATVSYLLAPLAKLGWLDYLQPLPMRLPSALFGALAVYLTYWLARAVAGAPRPALLAAAFVAFDPLSVLWGGFARMYALLQVVTLVVVILFLRALVFLDDPAAADRRRARPWLLGFAVAFWLAIFTQVVAALLWPVFALVALVLYGRTLLTSRRGLTLALGVAALAPVAFVALSTFVGYGSSTSRVQHGRALGGDAGFLGDDALDFGRFLHPALRGLGDLFGNGWWSALAPVAIAVLSGIALGRYVLARRADGAVDGRAVGILLLLFWTPMAVFALFVDEQKPRYLLNVLPFGYIVAALALGALAS